MRGALSGGFISRNCNSGQVLYARNEKTPVFTGVSSIEYGGGIDRLYYVF